MPSVEEQSLFLLQISSPFLARQMVISCELLDGVYVLFADHSSLRGREGRDNQNLLPGSRVCSLCLWLF